MALIAYAWELGSGFGHIRAFLPLARRLRTAGHEVLFIVRDLLHAESELSGRGFRCFQAPLWQGTLLGLPDPPASFSEILLHCGYFRAEPLLGLTRAWRELFGLLRPDLLIADYSPTALLAARILGLPAATFGTGFCRPPPLHPLPNLRTWQPIDPQRVMAADRQVIAGINEVLRTFGRPPIARVAELFDVDEDFLCTFPELDHYPERPQPTKYWGAIHESSEGVAADWPADTRFRVFGYLKPGFPGLNDFIDQIRGLPDCQVLLFCPGLAPRIREQWTTSHLTILPQPVNIQALAATLDAAVCHAGHGTVAAMLQAGIPLLLLPIHLEQHLTAKRVMDLGAGLAIGDAEVGPDFAGLLNRLLNDPRYRRAATRFAEQHREETQEWLQERLYQSLMQLVENRGTDRSETVA